MNEVCQYGHPMTPENTYIRKSNGWTECRECRQAQWRDKNARLRIARAMLAGPLARRRGRAKEDPETRFWRRVEVRGTDECWPWTGRLSVRGYGQYNVAGRTFSAPRWAAVFSGMLRQDDEQVVAHSCGTRHCCNPTHLLLMSFADAVRRGGSPAQVAHREGRCTRGHPHTPENVRRLKSGSLACRVCEAAYQRRYDAVRYGRRRDDLPEE